MGIMGASGSGKTTLLNCISTIDTVSAGHIYLNGTDVTEINEKQIARFRRENLGFVFQDFNLLDTLTISENIALALTINRVPAGEIDGRVREIAGKLNITDILDKYPYQVSGGQKQRCACARAIINQPKLILADEPTGALDSHSSQMLLSAIQSINETLGATILMVTHDAFSASYANRILFLRDGTIFTEIFKGSPFYASVECRERGLDPLDTNLVVADESRTDKTICLAVTPSLKSYGISGRGRLFEVKQRVKEANAGRQHDAPGHRLDGTSHFFSELQANPSLAIDFIIAPPRMAYYMEYSTRIYQVYLKYIAPEDIVVYSIDEVFMDVTDYLNTYKLSAHDLAMKIILDVLETTGITATAGIGTNLFLCKVAMDIVAKHIPADKNGVRIAELDEMKFRRELWTHQPLTDFWRVGRGIAKKLEQNGMFTMGDVALCSERNEDLLYKLFGKNAELLIDHAWGWEPTTIEAIKAYRPSSNSLSSGQVLHCPYEPQKAKLVVREMTDLLVLDLVDKGLVTDQMVLTVGYDIENLTDPARRARYHGAVEKDPYGREIPKQARGSINLGEHTSSTRKIMCAVSELFDRIVDKNLLVRRMYVVANHVLPEVDAPKKNDGAVQLDLFTDYAAEEEKRKAEDAALERERKIQKAALAIKKKYGKNAILKAMNLEEGATAKDRNAQIGGHKA